MTCVVDASAAIHLGRMPSLAAALAMEHDAVAPALLAWEVGQVVHVKRRSGYGDAARRTRVVQTLLSGIQLRPHGADAEVARLAARHALTYYDASYLQVAVEEDAILLTEDERLHKAARKELGLRRAWRMADAAKALAAD